MTRTRDKVRLTVDTSSANTSAPGTAQYSDNYIIINNNNNNTAFL